MSTDDLHSPFAQARGTGHRPRRGRALLVEELAVDAVRVADENVGAPAGVLQGAVGHAQVVLDHLQLRDTGLGEVDLVGVGDGDLLAGDVERDRGRLGGHAIRISRASPSRAVASIRGDAPIVGIRR